MKRRAFITLLGAATALPFAARAQQPPTVPVIGFLNGASSHAPYLVGLRQGLKEVGYIEGQNVAIEYRWADGQYDRLPAMAADLVSRQVSVIVANTPAARTAQAATKTVPIVFLTGTDPVAFGLVASLSRPGGNITGVASLVDEVAAKRLELLRGLLPKATVIGVLSNPSNPNTAIFVKNVQAAAGVLGWTVHVLNAGSEREIGTALATFAQLQASGFLVVNDPFFNSRPDYLVAQAARHSLPAIYAWREFVVAGGLMSYGVSLVDLYRQGGIYVGHILKGEKPADLPVQQSTKVELVINLRTAAALGITVPPTILATADEVIE